MSKFLVARDGGVESEHDFPLNFSVAGHYVVDVPTALQVQAATNSVADLVAAKLTAFKGLHTSLPYSLSDELITSPNVDPVESSRYTLGPEKRTILFPAGGQIVTAPMAVGVAITTIFAHWYGFTLYVEPAAYPSSGAPPPDRILYNYNPVAVAFQEFDPTTFTVEVRDSTNTSTLATLTPDVEQAFSFGPGNIRLRFTNNVLDRHYHLSDWVLLFG